MGGLDREAVRFALISSGLTAGFWEMLGSCGNQSVPELSKLWERCDIVSEPRLITLTVLLMMFLRDIESFLSSHAAIPQLGPEDST